MATRTSKDAERAPATADAAAFVDRFESAWSKSDAGALIELLAEDVVLIQPGMPSTTGREAARDAFSKLLRVIPDLHVRVHRWAARGELLFIEFTLVGTFGGRELSWPAVDRFLLRDGLAAERVSYFDPMTIFLATLTRPRGWPDLIRSGFRPSFSSSPSSPSSPQSSPPSSAREA